MKSIHILLIAIFVLSTGCVSSKKFEAANSNTSKEIIELKKKVKLTSDKISKLDSNIKKQEQLFDEKTKNIMQKISQIEQLIDGSLEENKNLRDLISSLRIEVVQLRNQIEQNLIQTTESNSP